MMSAAVSMLSLRPEAVKADTRAQGVSTLGFREIPRGNDPQLHVPAGYRSQTLMRWGDPMFTDAQPLAVKSQTAAAQARQFGYNCDFTAYLPLGKDLNEQRGILVVNHESSYAPLMFPGSPSPKQLDKRRIDVEIAAQGMSVIAISKQREGWRPQLASHLNRRVTPWTEMRFAGPAAGHKRLRTHASPDGMSVLGTFGNCSGGVTPWGTVLSAEENIDYYFQGDASSTSEAENYARFGFKKKKQLYNWGAHYARWDLDREPAAGLHYGWIVELDPLDPASRPVKRTALGRFRHENCSVHVNADGHVVAYMGDDQAGEHIYRFVTAGKYNPARPVDNRDLLDQGTLSVARFEPDGRLVWLPLVAGVGPLQAANGFNGPADIVLDTRKAADLVGATPMDRPEEVAVNPVTGTVFAMLTGNPTRLPGQTDAANPRALNVFGHILEMSPPDGDHTAAEFRWEIFLLGGDPGSAWHGARYHPQVSQHGWLGAPDNCEFDGSGRLWIATDGSNITRFADGIFASDVRGPGRALTRQFLRAPLGAEVSGLSFTPDYKTLFCAIQHPGAARGSRFEQPATRWPDFDPALPPRPAVVAVSKDDAGIIGS